MTGYLAFIPAELIGVSAVLAAVTAGVYLGWHTPELTTPQVRLQGVAVWEIVQYLLNALLFVLVGLQLPIVLDALGEIPVATLVGYAALVSLTVIAVRFAWVFVVLLAPRAVASCASRAGAAPSSSRGPACAARVSLAAALALPLQTDAGDALPRPRPDPLPHLLGDPRHARRAGPDPPARDPGARARGRRPGRARGREGAHLRGGGGDRPARRARAGGVGARGHGGAPARRCTGSAPTASGRASATTRTAIEMRSQDFQRLRHELLEAERSAVLELRRSGAISNDVWLRVSRDLDLEDQRLDS